MKHLKFFGILLLIGTLWVACKDNFIEMGKTADVTFAGRILDENNQPIIGAVVQAGNQSATTDVNGVFRLATVRLSENNALINVKKEGYFRFSRAYVVANGAVQSISIQLIKKAQVGSFIATQGSVVQVPGGPTLQFPANSVATANGNAYSGMVLVYAHYLDPAAPDLSLSMPGDLRGINLSGEEQVLATFGMITVELVGATGEELQVAAGSEVEIAVPIAASQSTTAPATIPLWYYDLDKARWIEEGSAQKIGSQYVGKVKHFSYWNYDASYPAIFVHGKIFIGDDQHPLSNAIVWIGPADQGLGWGCGHGSTDDHGSFGGAIPADISLRIRVLLYDGSPCDTSTLYEQVIGPFNSDVTLPPIIITANSQLETVTISGRLLDCNGQALTNGYAKINKSSGISWGIPDAQGFIKVNFLHCSANPDIVTVTAYDLSNLRKSQAQNFSTSPNTINLGDISICENLSAYIQYNLDGQIRVMPEPFTGWGDSTYTSIYAVTPQGLFLMSFGNNQSIGTFPVIQIYDQIDSVFVSDSYNFSTTVTAFGDPGQLIIGTFGGLFPGPNSSVRTIEGNYHVIRQ